MKDNYPHHHQPAGMVWMATMLTMIISRWMIFFQDMADDGVGMVSLRGLLRICSFLRK